MLGKKGSSGPEREVDLESQRPSKRARVEDSDDTKEAHPSEDASRDLANDDWDEEEVGEDEHEPARASDLYLDTVSSSVYHSQV